MRLDRLTLGLVGDAKMLRDGVSELRVDHGPGYRVYFARDGRSAVLPLVRRRQGEPSRRYCASRPLLALVSGKKMKATANHDEFMRERLADASFAAEYLQAAIEDGETAVLLLALRRITEARGGMSKLARETGLSRETLYRMLSVSGNPRLSSLRAIVAASGLRLSVAPSKPSQRR